MSTAATVNAAAAPKNALDSPPKKDLSGLIPYLRRYTWGIVFGLLVVVLMGIIGNVVPLAIGIMMIRWRAARRRSSTHRPTG